LLASCGSEPDRDAIVDMNEQGANETIAGFWTWFESHKDEFNDMEVDRDQALDSILEELSSIEEGLSVEISNETNGIREIVISPEGVREKFDMVKKIVSQAPDIEGWKVVAFRQPVDEDFTLRYGDLELTPSKLYFCPLEKDGVLDIIVYGDGFDNYEDGILTHYGLIMIDNLIGEYDCVTEVRYYDFQDLSQESQKEGLLPLS
jgi:hypothetical protein